MQLSSPRFQDGADLPLKYARDGENISPPFQITEVPSGARSLALFLVDIDSPLGPFTHWVVWNLPPEVREIRENDLPPPAHTGMNGFGSLGYHGPCPPSGRHRYRFRLVALDAELDATPPDRKDHIENEMEGHVLAEATLTVLFEAGS